MTTLGEIDHIMLEFLILRETKTECSKKKQLRLQNKSIVILTEIVITKTLRQDKLQ